MGMYKHLAKLWQDEKEKTSEINKQRIISWRKQPSIVRINKPTRLDKARRVGYKAKQGFVVVRAKIKKGRRKKPQIPKGRKPKRYGMFFTTAKNLQSIVEQRVNRKFPNMEVLNSYLVGNDSIYNWYEVILLDRAHPAVLKDKDVGRIVLRKKRTYRGLTSAGKKSRGARRKKK